MNSTTTTLAERLVLARGKRGLKQETLAELVGLTQQGLSDLERGKAEGSTRIARLAHELGVSAYWLETGLGEQYGGDALSSEERLVVETLRQMTPAKRKAFMGFFLPPGNSK